MHLQSVYGLHATKMVQTNVNYNKSIFFACIGTFWFMQTFRMWNRKIKPHFYGFFFKQFSWINSYLSSCLSQSNLNKIFKLMFELEKFSNKILVFKLMFDIEINRIECQAQIQSIFQLSASKNKFPFPKNSIDI